MSCQLRLLVPLLALPLAAILSWRHYSQPFQPPVAENLALVEGMALRVERTMPTGDDAVSMAARPLEEVRVEYLLTNEGDAEIEGLTLDGACQCSIVTPPPKRLASGAAARIALLVRAPHAGNVVRTLTVHGGQPSRQLALLTARLCVACDPPSLLKPFSAVDLYHIEGDERERRIVLRTIERRGTEPWLSGITVSPNSLAEASLVSVRDQPTVDPLLITRAYEFSVLAKRDRPVGTHSGVISLRTRGAVKGSELSAALSLRVLEAVALLPNPLILTCSPQGVPQPRTATVLARGLEAPKLESIDCNHGLIEAQILTMPSGQDCIAVSALAGAFDGDIETDIVLHFSGGIHKLLTVHLPAQTRTAGSHHEDDQNRTIEN